MRKITLLLTMLIAMSVGTTEAQGLKGLWKSIKKEWKDAGKSTSTSSTHGIYQQNSSTNSTGNTKPQQKVDWRKMPTITGKPLPEEQGWTLVKSNTIAGLKCDHYEKGTKTLRVFKKDNGDFITLDEDPDGLSREPAYNRPEGTGYVGDTTMIYPHGEYRLTTKDGTVVTGGYYDTFVYVDLINEKTRVSRGKGITYTFPSGDAISVQQFESDEQYGNYIAEKGQTPVSWKNFNTCEKIIPDQPAYLYLKEWHNIRAMAVTSDVGRGFLFNKHLYAWNPDAHSITTSIAQLFNNHLYPTIPSDTIVSVTNNTYNDVSYIDLQGHLVKYANGDEMLFDQHYKPRKGKIHRLGGVMTVKDGLADFRVRIDYPDGKVYAGTIAYPKRSLYSKETSMFVLDDKSDTEWLSHSDLVPWTGAYEYPDGTIANLTRGMSDKEVAAEKAARLAAEKKAKEEKAKAKQQALQALYKQYGKQYVDIVMKGHWPVVGMPIGLVKQFYDCRESGGGSYTQCYHIYGTVPDNTPNTIGFTKYTWVMTIWVRNGRVASFSKFYNLP